MTILTVPSRRMPLVAVAMALLVALLLGSAPASAQTSTAALRLTRVSLTQVRDMVHARGHLFVSSHDEVRVFDERGRLRKRLTKLPEATGLAVSPEGDRVYVAVRGANRVAVIDTRRLKVVKQLGVDPCPTRLALAGGRLFYTTATCSDPQAEPLLASIDPVRGGAPVRADVADVPDPAILVGGGSTLVVAPADESGAVVVSYRVSGTSVARLGVDVEEGYVWDLAISPDGRTVYVPRSYPWQVRAFPTASMTGPVEYVTAVTPEALAASPDGRSFAAGLDDSDADLLVFRAGSTRPVWSGLAAWSGASRPEVVGGSLTYSADGTKLFALFAAPDLSAFYLTSARV